MSVVLKSFGKVKIACLVLGFFAVVATALVVPSQSASAEVGYPDNLPPGEYSTVPFTIQTNQYTGVDRVGNPVCYIAVNVVIDASYAIRFNGPHQETAFFYIQKPSTNNVYYAGETRSTTAYQTATVNGYAVPNPWLSNNTVTFPEGKYGMPISGYYVDASVPPNGSVCDLEDLTATKSLFEGYAANSRVWWNGARTIPSAAFEFEVTDPATREVTFTNRSTDGGSGNGGLSYQWNFGDGDTSTEVNPVHVYGESGPFVVTLTVSNGFGDQASASETILDELGLVVNSSGDLPAEDAEVGCDTGGVVDGKPECTLRAAIQASQAKGGGEITFDIDGSGVPTISVASALPALTSNTSIDGTTQSGGQVSLVGPGASSSVNGISVTGGSVVLKGLVINSFASGVVIDGGTGHVLDGVRIGVNPAGSAASSPPKVGVDIKKGKTTITHSQVVADGGVVIGADASDVEIIDNAFGVNDARTGSIGEMRSAIGVAGPNVQIKNNVIDSDTVGVVAVGAGARDGVVQDNHIGVNSSGSPLSVPEYGVRVDGVPDFSVISNTIISETAGVGSAGSPQFEAQENGDFELAHPNNVNDDAPVTGGNTTIRGNTIGDDDSNSEEYDFGVVVWAGSTSSSVESNTIVGQVKWGIQVEGGANHKITGNTIGDGSNETGVDVGVLVFDTSSSTVGGDGGASNTISANSVGIDVQGGQTTSLSLVRNTVRFADEGIDVDSDSKGVSLTNNVVRNNEIGINIEGDNATLKGNVVSLNNLGIDVSADGVTLENNRVGLDVSGNAVLGNTTVGVNIDGDVVLKKNIIAGSSTHGVNVSSDSKATLTSNAIYASGGNAINSASGADSPTGVAAIRKTSPTSTRTTLIFKDLPQSGGGTLEVFADDDCSAQTGGQARYVLDIKRVTKPGETTRIVQILGNASRDSFTATYTDADGNTSELSNCVEAKSDYPDSDRDGSVDPIDSILGMDDDPSAAWVVTDSEELILVKATSFEIPEGEDEGSNVQPASLENVEIIDDPAPGAHPSGWQLPYGVLQFRVNVPEVGGRANVTLSNFLASSEMPDAQYFKYGPQTAGGTSSWYNFAFEESSNTGATLVTGNTPLGFRRSFSLSFQDGARGDSDGGANRTITDPGAVVLGAEVTDNPDDPDDVTPLPGVIVVPAPGNVNVGGKVISSADQLATSQTGSLPTTGTNSGEVYAVALALILIGFVLAGAKRYVKSL